MSEVEKIVKLLTNEAIEKQIAAAIVLGELKAKGPGVVEGLGVAKVGDRDSAGCELPRAAGVTQPAGVGRYRRVRRDGRRPG